jgi:hypothetical protein
MRSRRKLKAGTAMVLRRGEPLIHDRQATQLPAGAKIAVVVVDDPYEAGGRISAVASLRDDPLGLLHARYQLDDAKFMAGRHWQRLYEAAEIGAIKGVDTTLEPVDGRGQHVEVLNEVRRKAIRKLARCTEVLGERGDRLLRDVLAKGMFIRECAASRGLETKKGEEYIGQRFRECLETLAKEFGYA